MQKKRRGFTLIEVMITVAIIGAAVAMVLVYQSKAESRARVSDTVLATTNMTSKIRANYASVGSYNGLTPAQVHSMGLVIEPLRWDGANIRDAWGSIMNIEGNAAGATSTFVITFGGTNSGSRAASLTAEECVSLATQLANHADLVNVGTSTVLTSTNGLAGGGKAYKASGNILSIANLTDAAGCSAVKPGIALQYH